MRGTTSSPTAAEATIPSLPPTLNEAIQLTIENARANVKLFDELLESVTAQDVKLVFTHLRDASANRSIWCLERAVR